MEADIHIYTLDSRKLPRPCLLYQLEPHIAQLKVTLSWRSLIEKRSLAFHLLTSRSGARASCVSWSRWAAPRAASRPPARQPSSWDVLAVDSPKSSPFPSLSLSISLNLPLSVRLSRSFSRPRGRSALRLLRCVSSVLGSPWQTLVQVSGTTANRITGRRCRYIYIYTPERAPRAPPSACLSRARANFKLLARWRARYTRVTAENGSYLGVYIYTRLLFSLSLYMRVPQLCSILLRTGIYTRAHTQRGPAYMLYV